MQKIIGTFINSEPNIILSCPKKHYVGRAGNVLETTLYVALLASTMDLNQFLAIGGTD